MMPLFKKTEDILNKKKKINHRDEIKYNNKNLDKDDYFCCPKCKERILISLNPENFSLSYDCENNHKETNLDYNIFYQNRYINKLSNRICQQCKKEKLNNNKTINCNICNMKLCGTCIIQHKNMYKHNNFGLIYNSIKKCSIHDLDVSQFCKSCKKNLCTFCLKKNDDNNEHLNHEIVNFSDLIPGEKEIKNNEEKLKQKIIKNNSIIDKLIKWKEEICSLIDETIEKLNKDKLINKMIIQNFNWKYLDYINYKNYENAIDKLEIQNEELDKFLKSKMFIEQTNTIMDYLFGKERIKIDDMKNENNNIINNEINIEIKNNENNIDELKDEKINNKKIIENEIRKEIQFNIINEIKNYQNDEILENNIIENLKNEKALLFNNNSVYSYSLENKKITKIFEDDKNDDKNMKQKEEYISENLNALKYNLSKKIGNYNILIWKFEDDFKEDKLIKLIKDEKEKTINKFKIIQISKNTNFNITQKKKNERLIINEENENRGSDDNLLFSESNSLFNSNINDNNNNRLNNGLFNNINNENTRLFTNFNSSNNYGIQQVREEEEYVYISRTGAKYHGRPQCGRMKSSTRVPLSRAKALGLGPCMKCY